MLSKTSKSIILSALVLLPFVATGTEQPLETPTTTILSHSRLAGTWRIQGRPNNMPGFTNIASITTGGEIINVDPSFGTGVGAVSHLGGHVYSIAFHGFHNTTTLDTYEVRGTVTLSRNRSNLAGSFVTTIRDAAGKMKFKFPGAVLGTRL